MARARGASLLGALVVMGALLPLGGYGAPQAKAAGTGFSATKTVTRDQLLPDGSVSTVDARTVSLSVGQTQNLRGLQQIDVSWTGAHPTGGFVADPNDGTQAPRLEYPMVLLECRGVDSTSAPSSQQLNPDTCWTAYEVQERSYAYTPRGATPGVTAPSSFPGWRLDMYAPPAQRAAMVGVPDPSTPAGSQTVAQLIQCAGSGWTALYWQPFVAADGTVYYPAGCAPIPPEAAGSGVAALPFPSNETYAQTGPDGSGRAKFDVFTANENASLGCSDTAPCALVAVPIMGLSCDLADSQVPAADRASSTQTVQPLLGATPISALADADQNCTEVGSLPYAAPALGGPQDLAVQGTLWWAASNWRNRITVPLTFAPVQDPCASAPPGRSELDIYGSQLMTQVMAQWDPHFCQDANLFTLKHVQTAEGTARTTVAQHNSSAAFASYAPTGTYDSPVVNAPVALTGFAIAFSIDNDNGDQVLHLNLDARLLAKLLTESYPTDSNPNTVGANDTGCASGVTTTPCAVGAMSKNPLNMYQDPEFRALNPGFGVAPKDGARANGSEIDGASTLYALSTNSDVMYALASYLINDPEAKAWLFGAPDPWGMVVNPAYNLSYPQYQMPTNAWPLLDQYASPTEAKYCQAVSYLNMVAAPVQSLDLTAQAVEFAHPLSNFCKDLINGNSSTDVYGFARDDPMPIGHRFILGLVSLGEAQELNLPTASLETQGGAAGGAFAPASGRTFVAPTNASLAAAAKLLKPDPTTGTWQIPDGAIASTSTGRGAYPGTMLVNAEIPVSGLAATDAADAGKFLQFAAGPGQTPGTGYGQLPDGYLPMTAANGMGDLVAYTQAAAAAVAAQSGVVPPLPGQAAGGGGGGGAGGGPGNGAGSPTATSHDVSTVGTTSTSTTGTSITGGSGGSGGQLGLGPRLGGLTSQPGGAQSPVQGTVPNVAAAVVGKTLRLFSAVAGSLVRWLTYLALLALLLAAGIYLFYGRTRWERFGPGLSANLREVLMGVFARRRSP